MRTTAILGSVLAFWTVACGSEAPMSETEISELELESVEQDLMVTNADSVLTDTPLVDFSLDGEPSDEEFDFDANQNKCSPEKQMACANCSSSCDELCQITEGQLPTKCLTNCLSRCPKSCDKCVTF